MSDYITMAFVRFISISFTVVMIILALSFAAGAALQVYYATKHECKTKTVYVTNTVYKVEK